jgi:hypothetical protein
MTGGLLGWAILALLTSLATLDALGIAVRARTSGRAELALVATAAWFALLGTPVLVLGYTNVLTPGTLVLAAAALFGGTFVALARGRGWREVVRESLHAARAIASMPLDALREAARARSIVLLACLVCGALLALALLQTVFCANTSWDGFLYHEPIVGFAIQNHGFAIVPLQAHQAVQAANGYPHLCEAVTLWLVVFTDKTLIELPSVVGAPAMMLAVYVLARRFGDRVTAIGWACVLLLMPHCWTQLCGTMIDMTVAFFALFAVHFATRPALRLSDALLAMLGMALVLESKSSGLVIVPPIALLLAARLVAGPWRSRPRATLAVLAAGGGLLIGLGLLVPLRNWAAFHDPLWPVSFESRALRIHWGGLISPAELGPIIPLQQVIEHAYDHPIGGIEDAMARGYGYAVAWIVVPLGLVAVVVGLGAALLEKRAWREGGRAWNLGLVLALVVTGIMTTLTLNGQNARYNIHLVAGMMVGVTWLLSGRRWAPLREAVLGASIVLSLLPLVWMKGLLWPWFSTEHPEDMLRHPLASRTALERPSLDRLARERNEELRPGDWAVFDQDVYFVGALWNFDFSNRVKYVKYESSQQFVVAVEEMAPKWVAVGKDGDPRSALERTNRWELVGEIGGGSEVVFRRKGSRPSTRDSTRPPP